MRQQRNNDVHFYPPQSPRFKWAIFLARSSCLEPHGGKRWVATSHHLSQDMWVAGGGPLMPEACVTCSGRDQGQDKRVSGTEHLHHSLLGWWQILCCCVPGKCPLGTEQGLPQRGAHTRAGGAVWAEPWGLELWLARTRARKSEEGQGCDGWEGPREWDLCGSCC